MNRISWTLPVLLFLIVQACPVWGSECDACHQAKGVRESAPAIDPIAIKADGETRSITLADAFRFHGHSCPGVTITFKALQYGLQILFGKEIPDRKDIVVISRTPQPGGLDFLDLAMIGGQRAAKSQAPKGMTASRDTIAFTFIRKSTRTAADIQLKPEHFPKDFFAYKKKQSEKKLSSEEWQVLHDYMKDMILRFPTMSFESLFGKTQPYKIVAWGIPLPAHAGTLKPGDSE